MDRFRDRREERRERRREQLTEELDAGCTPGLEEAIYVSEENIPFLVLFASVDWDDRDALEKRANEWRELFKEVSNGV